MIENGIHYLSGVERSVSIKNPYGWDEDEMLDADLFVIDGVTYAAYIDPNDGFRSYGVIAPTDMKCRFTFPPQRVIIEHKETNEVDEYGYDTYHSKVMIIKDAYLDKEVLVIGTDYTDSYYPMAICNYNPMNLYINVERSIRGN